MIELLRFEHVDYKYQGQQEALHDLNVSINAGERVAVLGENGAGKSTFFLLANGVLSPEKGKIFFKGTAINNNKKSLNVLRKGGGLVFQDPDVRILGGSVEEEISFGPMNLGLPVNEVLRRVNDALSCFELQEYRNRAPHDLSGGEKKRVTLADSIVMNPSLLLLDEPASSLDPFHTRRLEENLDTLSESGMGLVISTHDVDFAWRWADRVLIFQKGRLRADGSPYVVLENDQLLKECGLEQPVLLRVARLLGMTPPPRTIEELEHRWNS